MGQVIQMLARVFQQIATPLEGGRTKMVFLVRTDLQMGKGKIASQVAHAAIQLYKQSTNTNNPYLKSWLRWGQPKIVLKVDNDKSIDEVYQKALKNNLVACKVFDAGSTQIEPGTLTVVGIGPGRVVDIDEITKTFKLL